MGAGAVRLFLISLFKFIFHSAEECVSAVRKLSSCVYTHYASTVAILYGTAVGE